jgi:predicted transport protein
MSIDLQDLNDPNEICSDVRGLGRWGSGNSQFGINDLNDVDYAFNLISQSYQSSMME